MNKKLPRVFANKIEKEISNNEKIYYSKNDNYNRSSEEIILKEETKNIYQKINDIFGSERYVYKADVDIKIRGTNKKVKIIGRNNGHLITIDNELIPITDIEDIKFSQ